MIDENFVAYNHGWNDAEEAQQQATLQRMQWFQSALDHATEAKDAYRAKWITAWMLAAAGWLAAGISAYAWWHR